LQIECNRPFSYLGGGFLFFKLNRTRPREVGPV